MSKSLAFTKMHGAGNDFVMLDNTHGQIKLDVDLIKRLANRHMGIGADQVLIVEKPDDPANDFKYRIFNADGQEVQQCGNGARCFAQFVLQKKLTDKTLLQVETLAGVISPRVMDSVRVQVNMGPVRFNPELVPFVADGLATRQVGHLTQYLLPVDSGPDAQECWVGVATMGNPHVVMVYDRMPSDSEVEHVGRILESHPRFPERVNVGFMSIIEKNKARLRVHERGVGETLACGTGACAAATIGMQMGLLADRVEMVKLGGTLLIEWDGELDSPVMMTGPTQTVFEGVFSL